MIDSVKQNRMNTAQSDDGAAQGVQSHSEAAQVAAVQEDCWIIEHIQNPSEAVQLAAVQADGLALSKIKNPGHAVCLGALRENLDALGFFPEDISPTTLEIHGALLHHQMDRRNGKLIEIDSIRFLLCLDMSGEEIRRQTAQRLVLTMSDWANDDFETVLTLLDKVRTGCISFSILARDKLLRSSKCGNEPKPSPNRAL